MKQMPSLHDVLSQSELTKESFKYLNKNCFRWVLAVDMYEKVAKTIAPKRESLQKAESDYQAITFLIVEGNP